MIQCEEQFVWLLNLECHFEEMVRLRDWIAGTDKVISAVQDSVIAGGLPPDRIGLVGEPRTFCGLVDHTENAKIFNRVPVLHIVEMGEIHDHGVKLHCALLPKETRLNELGHLSI